MSQSFAVSDASLVLDLVLRDHDSVDPRNLHDQFRFALSFIKTSRQLENRDRLRTLLLTSLEKRAHLLSTEELFPILVDFVRDSPRDEVVSRRIVELIEKRPDADNRMTNDLLSLFKMQGRGADQPG